MELRYYQRDAIEALYKFCQDNPGRNPCIVLPTGGGKTHVIVQVCRDVQSWQGRVLILAHVKELLDQAASKLKAVDGLDVGIYSAGLNSRDTDSDIIVAGIQSVYNRGLELAGSRPFNIVIVDEAHRIPLDGEGMYCQLLNDLKAANPKLRVVGLTATPYRTGKGYVCGDSNILNDICYEADIKELIAGGFLCELSSKRSVASVDMGGVAVYKGEYKTAEMEQRFNVDDKVKSAVDEIVRYSANRKKVLIFCCGIDHASSVAMELDAIEPGKVRVVTSHHGERDNAIESFKMGSCKYLVNVNCLTEGFDATAIDCVVLLRATISPGLYYQMVGRGLRTDPSKSDCLVLDFGGNVQRHGTIDNLKIGKARCSGGEGEAPVKPCPNCNELVHAGLLICTACGFEFPPIEPNHEASASDDSPLEGPVVEVYQVDSVGYSIHQKRTKDGESQKPPSMRVTYYDGVNSVVADEWICVEHSGFAFEKALSWWQRRSANPMPRSVEDAVAMANQGALIEPSAIRVKITPGERFTKIVGYDLGPRPTEAIEISAEEDLPW